MKKTYIIPSLQVIEVNSETLIAISRFEKNDTGATSDVVLVKRDRSSYNVWDEDWQNP